MRDKKLKKTIAFLVAVFVVAICSPAGSSCNMQENGEDKIEVVVSILPQAEFVEAIGGDNVKVTVMIPPGSSPHTYEPSPQQMVALSRAKMYAKVGSGVEFELNWLEKLTAQNNEMLVIDCSKGIDLREDEAGHNHDNGSHGHGHGSRDPHIWLSVINAKIMVQNIYEGMVQLDPDNEAHYRQNLNDYIEDLESLHQKFSDGFAEIENPVFMIYHPALGYFAHDYGLTQLPVEDEGKQLTPKGLDSVIRQAREHDVGIIFTSPQFNPENAKVVASEIGGTVIPLDPLAREYIQNMRNIFEMMLEAMQND